MQAKPECQMTYSNAHMDLADQIFKQEFEVTAHASQ